MSNATKNDNTTFYIKLINDTWTDLLLKNIYGEVFFISQGFDFLGIFDYINNYRSMFCT